MLGVGSTYFTRGIVESLITKGGEWDVRLVDIDPQCLEIAAPARQAPGGRFTMPRSPSAARWTGARCCPARMRSSRPSASAGGSAWEKDVTIFRQFNVYQSTGDTYGAGGVSRALRTIPVLVESRAGHRDACAPMRCSSTSPTR